MAFDSVITDRYALYHGDSCEELPKLPSSSIHLGVYSPPFAGLYQYSSSDRDLSNCKTQKEFFDHYEFIINEMYRVTLPGRLNVIHCMDVPRMDGEGLLDLPGEIIRMHERAGFVLHGKWYVWKEPLRVAIRTRAKNLTHRQLMQDSTVSGVATPDTIVVMRKKGSNPVPVSHECGLTTEFAGMQENIPEGFYDSLGKWRTLAEWKEWKDPKSNCLSQWIWRQYASPFWDDVRIDRVLPYKKARENEEEKHCHPLQRDVVARYTTLWSNPGERVLTPFCGVGTEVYEPVKMGRFGVGIELKASYFRQAIANLAKVDEPETDGQNELDMWDEEAESRQELFA